MRVSCLADMVMAAAAAIIFAPALAGYSACVSGVVPAYIGFSKAGGAGKIAVQAAVGCSWTATPAQSWIHLTAPSSNIGPGAVAFTVDAYDGNRDGAIQIEDMSVAIHVIPSAAPPKPSVQYLIEASDRFQHTVDVYTDADAAGNHFPARGRMNSLGGDSAVPVMDEVSAGVSCFRGLNCITAQLKVLGNNWGGWYFLNGVLGNTDRQPIPNWGDKPNAGFDLSGATTLQFAARGKSGGEVVEFFAFGVGRDSGMPYPDSSPKLSLEGIHTPPRRVRPALCSRRLRLECVECR